MPPPDSPNPQHLTVALVLPEILRREVEHRGLLREGTSLATQLIAWVEMG